jgi:hypothetical protein
LPLALHADAAPYLVQAVVDDAIVDGTFYTGTFNWYWQAGVLGQLSMRGYASTLNGGTITQVTACLFSESSFSRNFTATASVVQGSSTIQSITFSRSFPPNQFTCHTLTGFNATVAPGEFAVLVSYDKFLSDNLFAGLASTDSGQVFDVQIGTARPPFATGPQGPIQIRGVGIRYRIDENDQQPPPPPACIRDAFTACLLNDRFEVTGTWQTAGNSGSAQVMYFGGQRAESNQSVFMWFFNGSNFEIGIKMVTACAPPFEHFWAFVSGLTNQAFTVTITDTQTGMTWTHSNPLGQFPLTEGDTAAFGCP